MKTETVIDGVVHWHSQPLIAHVEGAGHIGFVSKLPLPLRVQSSILMFFAHNGLMQCSQSTIPDDVSLLEALAQVYMATRHKHAAPQLAAQMRSSGQYVGLGVIFTMQGVEVQDDTPDSEIRHLIATKPLVRTGIIATHDGKMVTAEWRRGRYVNLPGARAMDDTEKAFIDTHEALCRLADTPPKRPGRRLRDMYQD